MGLKIKADTIQFGIFIVMMLGLIGTFWAYCEVHFANASAVAAVDRRVDTEVSERREQEKEMKAEMDGIYTLIVPREKQITIRHPGSVSQ